MGERSKRPLTAEREAKGRLRLLRLCCCRSLVDGSSSVELSALLRGIAI